MTIGYCLAARKRVGRAIYMLYACHCSDMMASYLKEELSIDNIEIHFHCLIQNQFNLNHDSILETIALFKGKYNHPFINQEQGIRRELRWYSISELRGIAIQPACLLDLIPD